MMTSAAPGADGPYLHLPQTVRSTSRPKTAGLLIKLLVLGFIAEDDARFAHTYELAAFTALQVFRTTKRYGLPGELPPGIYYLVDAGR